MRILLSNDDGVLAPGLRTLASALAGLAEITVVAPEREQSASSHSLTLDRPLRIRQLEERVYSVDGTPTDCVLLAVRGASGVLRTEPDLIVSGINHGPNLGDDVLYSGTVAAAAEGCLMGIPSIAISLAASDAAASGAAAPDASGFEPAGQVARSLIEQLLVHAGPDHDLRTVMPAGTLLNVNIPGLSFAEIRGFRVARLGRRAYPDAIVRQTDPRGRPYYWIGGEQPDWESGEDTDYHAIGEGCVSVTPLQLDLTHRLVLDRLRDWKLSLRPGSGPECG